MKHAIFILSILFLVGTSPAQASTTVADVLKTADGTQLESAWTLPAFNHRNPKAVVVLLPGSGNVGLDGDISSPMLGKGFHGQSAKISEQLSSALAAKGIASLRFSKRGFENPEQLKNQIIPFLVSDAVDAITAIKKKFPHAKTGIVGFSEGALVALMAMEKNPVDELFLFGLPSRSIDEIVNYQFKAWPMALLMSKADTNHDRTLQNSELAVFGSPGLLPVVGTEFGQSWKTFDTNHDGQLSWLELIAAYNGALTSVKQLLATPAYAAWYHSMKAVPEFSQLAGSVTVAPYLYQGMDDAQVKSSWIEDDAFYFQKVSSLRFFEGLGHAFAPMEGVVGEIKTSGPFSDVVMKAFLADATLAFSR